MVVIVFGGISFFFWLQNNHENYLAQQKAFTEEQARKDSDQRYTDCIDTALKAYTEREIEYCESTGKSQNYCVYNPPAIFGGTIYEYYQTDKNNCAVQFPGATIVP